MQSNTPKNRGLLSSLTSILKRIHNSLPDIGPIQPSSDDSDLKIIVHGVVVRIKTGPKLESDDATLKNSSHERSREIMAIGTPKLLSRTAR